MAKKTSEKPGDMVSFRLAREHMKMLESEAEAAGEAKPNLAARRHVERSLNNVGQSEIMHELGRVQADHRKLREDIATFVVVLLVQCANHEPTDAESFVREHLSP
jgi:hypothetical protein